MGFCCFILEVFCTILLFVDVGSPTTHFVLTDHGIRPVEGSFFQMKNPDNLSAFLEQEKVYDKFVSASLELIELKKISDAYEAQDDEEDIELKAFETDPDCIIAKKPLYLYDLHTGILVFPYPKQLNDVFSILKPQLPVKDDLFYNFDHLPGMQIVSSSDTCSSNRTSRMSANSNFRCSKHSPNSHYDLLDLPALRTNVKVSLEPEECILDKLGISLSLEEFGTVVNEALHQNPNSWNLYLLASLYWRSLGNENEAFECILRAFWSSKEEFHSIVLLSAATVLQRSNAFTEAISVLERIIEKDPKNVYAHYILGNIHASMTDFSKSISEFEQVLLLNPNFKEAKLRKSAVECHVRIEKGLNTQHEYLLRTLDNLEIYNEKSKIVAEYYKNMRDQQSSRMERLETRKIYRDFQRHHPFK